MPSIRSFTSSVSSKYPVSLINRYNYIYYPTKVHSNARKNHIVPITLVPVMCQLHQHQGITTLWKGLGSTLLIRGLSLGVEDLLSKITPWPKLVILKLKKNF